MNWERQQILDEAVLKTVRNEEEIDKHINSDFEAFPNWKGDIAITYAYATKLMIVPKPPRQEDLIDD